MATMANPDSSADVRLEAFSLALLSCGGKESVLPALRTSQGDQTDQGPEDQGYLGVPSVAFGPLVGLDDGDDGGAPHEAAPLQEDCEDPGRLSSQAIPGPSGGSAHFRQEFFLSRADHDLDEADLDFLSKHLASNTASGLML